MPESNEFSRVLIVDDHPMMRDGLRGVLTRAFPGLEVFDAATSDEALKRLPVVCPQLALLDVNIPGGNGLDLAREICQEHPLVRVLMVAGEADPWSVRRALEAGASGFLTKTNSAASLVDAVRAVLGGERFLCPDSEKALQRAVAAGEVLREPPGPAVLSDREREILRYLAHGENTKEIAVILAISPKTVETHRQHIMRKLRVQSVAALARYAVRHGLTVA